MPGPTFLAGDRVDLQTVTEADYEFLRHHANDHRVRQWLGGHTPLTDDGLSALLEDEDTVHLLPCVDGDPVGHVWLFRIHEWARRAELGYWIAPEHQGRGNGSAAASLATDYAFDDLDCHKLVARVYGDNDGSRAILEGIGFEREATLREHGLVGGEHVDCDLYGLLQRER